MTDELRPYGEDDDLLAKFSRWSKDIDAHWSSWATEAKEAYDLVAGHQWSDEEKSELMERLRPFVTFNSIAPVIDAVSGAEIQGRQQVTYLPRQVGASAVNEVLTKGAEWLRDQCDAEHEESDSAWDTFVCGMGCTESRMDYEEEPDGMFMVDRVDPLEIRVDPSSRKRNCADARYMRREKPYSREEFEQEWPGALQEGDDPSGKRVTIVDPAIRYENGMLDGDGDEDEVIVREWQWFEREPYYRVAHPDTGEVVESSPEEYEPMAEQATQAGVELGGVKQYRRVFYRAFEASGELLSPPEEMKVGDFTYTFMTGKRDRNKGVWYGLVRPMKDPQKFKNKFFSQILHIVNSNAKGGIMMEKGAAIDVRAFEETYSSPDQVTWLEDGALTSPNGPKWAEKKPPAYPQASDRLMQFSAEEVRGSTGVNLELLGLADRDQPGVLENQRKQAAYGILSAFFDSFKRYRKMSGRKMLRFMQLFMGPNTLVRITGDDGLAQYVPLALQDETIKFDVIVDDAPAGPNQKQQAFQMLLQLMPLLQNANLPPSIWAEFVRYSPLPNALSEKLIQALMQMQQQAGQPNPAQQLALADKQADVQSKQADAQHRTAQANRLNVETAAMQSGQPDPIHASDQEANSAKAALDRAKITGIWAKAVSDIAHATNSGPPLTSPA